MLKTKKGGTKPPFLDTDISIRFIYSRKLPNRQSDERSLYAKPV